MAMVHIEAQLPADELVQAVGQLSQSELDQFVAQILALHARRRAPSLPRAEADLLLQINQGLPRALQARYGELIARRQAETLTPAEYAELVRLTAQVEAIEAQRVEYLAELARLRQTTLTGLMQDLGIRTPESA